MRALILVAGAALAVAACSSKDNANNTMNVDENLTTTDMNTTTTDMNATDMNATDANMSMNATDVNATGNTTNIDENLTAENIVSNDVTAIDAVTGDAANMAADVNYQDVDNSSGAVTNAVAPSDTPRLKPNREATPPAKPTTTTATETTTNSD